MESKLSEIILRNTDISLIQCNVMFSVSELDDMGCFSTSKYEFNTQKPKTPAAVSYTTKHQKYDF